MDCSPPVYYVCGIFQARILEYDRKPQNYVKQLSFNSKNKFKKKREYWSVWPFPAPGDLPDPGIEPSSLASPALTGRFFTTSANWEARIIQSAFV